MTGSNDARAGLGSVCCRRPGLCRHQMAEIAHQPPDVIARQRSAHHCRAWNAQRYRPIQRPVAAPLPKRTVDEGRSPGAAGAPFAVA